MKNDSNPAQTNDVTPALTSEEKTKINNDFWKLILPRCLLEIQMWTEEQTGMTS